MAAKFLAEAQSLACKRLRGFDPPVKMGFRSVRHCRASGISSAPTARIPAGFPPQHRLEINFPHEGFPRSGEAVTAGD